jgi:hypothetical protein
MVVATLKHFFAKSGPNAGGIHLAGREASGSTAGVHEADGGDS